MTAQLRHRGPDADGHWFDAAAGVAFGHRRLAVVDLTSDGAQPMRSASGRFVITYNGEVYNFGELRKRLELAGATFRSRSDTEVILAAVEQWGVRATLDALIGMYAFALWDCSERRLWLCRDRLGKKPLYYGKVGRSLVFASEMKALRCYPGFEREVDRDSVALYLRHNYVPAPRSIYRGIHKLDAGTVASFDVRGDDVICVSNEMYWSARAIAEAAATRHFTGTQREAQQELETLLQDAVRIRMVADVPLGAFLSGGIDSSLVVALMQAQSGNPVRTFTVGFDEQSYDESHHARAVADHLRTDHTEVRLTPRDTLDVIPGLPQMYDEPFADVSQIPTYLVSKVAREHVTVALSGDGGDEFFCGYSRYVWWRQIWRVIGAIPPFARGGLGKALKSISAETWTRSVKRLGRLLPAQARQGVPGDRIHKVADLLSAGSPEALYQGLMSHWHRPGDVVIGAHEPPTVLSEVSNITNRDRFTERMMLLDTLTYLPDDILVKVDRASMAASLETRAPLLDHRVFELAVRLPLEYKLQGSSGKVILRNILAKYVPRELFERPKTGFGVPIDTWLRGPLRDWAESLLDPARLRNQGFFAVEPVRRAWETYLNDYRPHHYLLWDILMFQSWLEHERSGLSLHKPLVALRAAH
jgi:asparagine synthase (glutamine-hydrolysing)